MNERDREPSRADRVARTAMQILLLGALPVALLVMFIVSTVGDQYAFDFHGSLWQASRDIMAGRNPYPPPTVEGIASRDQFVYPPLPALVSIPLGLMPFPWAAGVMTVILVAAMSAALLVLGVRDWRCHGATLASVPMLHDVRLGAITPLLVLGVALIWRLRDTTWAGMPFALVVVTKLFFWPLGVWLLATRRIGAVASAVGITLVLVFGGWALIGFAGLAEYPALLQVLAEEEQVEGYSVVAAGMSLGLNPASARIVALVLGALVLAWTVQAARRGFDRRSFVLALGACYVLTPILWVHYFLLLYIPIAIRSPRFQVGWLLPLGFWLTVILENIGEASGSHWYLWLGLALVVMSLVWSARSEPAGAAFPRSSDVARV